MSHRDREPLIAPAVALLNSHMSDFDTAEVSGSFSWKMFSIFIDPRTKKKQKKIELIQKSPLPSLLRCNDSDRVSLLLRPTLTRGTKIRLGHLRIYFTFDSSPCFPLRDVSLCELVLSSWTLRGGTKTLLLLLYCSFYCQLIFLCYFRLFIRCNAHPYVYSVGEHVWIMGRLTLEV